MEGRQTLQGRREREGRQAAKAGEGEKTPPFYRGSENGKRAEGGPGPPSLGLGQAQTAPSPSSVGSGAARGAVGLLGGEDGGGGSYICQLDGNMSCSTSMDSEEEGEQGEEEDKEQEEEGDKVKEQEEDKEQEEAMTVPALIPVQLGHRPAPLPCKQRTPVRRTVQRSNKLVDALSAPRISLYNVRSAWSKWDSIAEDIHMRATDISILTEVWQKTENKRHQKLIESMLEMKGIKYVSTPRPGAKRGG